MMSSFRSFKVRVGAGLLLAAALAGYLVLGESLLSSESILCQGRDGSNGQFMKVVFNRGNDAQGTARLFTSADPTNGWSLQAEDALGISHIDGVVTQVVMRVSETTNFQVVKSCRPLPTCEINRFELPPEKVMKEEQDRINQAERLAYEYRRATAQTAAHFAQVRHQALEEKKNLERLKADLRSSPADVRQAEAAYKQNAVRATELAEKLQSMSAATHDVHRNSNQIRSTASIGKVQAASLTLEPFAPQEWCQ